MKNGYDQFFKQARKSAQSGKPAPVASAPRKKTQPQFSLSTEQLSQEVEKQLRQRAGVKPRKKSKVSWKMISLSFIGLAACIAGGIQHEQVEQFLARFEVTLLGQAQAETAKPPEAKKETTPAKPESKATVPGAEAEAKAKEVAAEEIGPLQKLVERKKQLDDRESELARTEDEIAKQKIEVEKRMKELEEMRGKISSILEERVKLDETKVDGLMQMYSNMKPPQAAKVFEAMDEDLAVEILGRMKKKNAAEILNLLKPEKAQVISEKYAGFRRQPATASNTKEGKP